MSILSSICSYMYWRLSRMSSSGSDFEDRFEKFKARIACVVLIALPLFVGELIVEYKIFKNDPRIGILYRIIAFCVMLMVIDRICLKNSESSCKKYDEIGGKIFYDIIIIVYMLIAVALIIVMTEILPHAAG